jgi:neutral ceramidase
MYPHRSRWLLVVLGSILALGTLAAVERPVADWVPVGVSKIDITPDLPIRLSGYASRKTEATEVGSRLYVRALAIGSAEPVVLLAVETIGFPSEFSAAVAAKIQQDHEIPRDRVALCATHIHNGPAIAGILEAQFEGSLSTDEVARIARYTEVLQTKLGEAAAAALADRRPGRLEWGQGQVGFATQRRRIVEGKWVGFGAVSDGTTDHRLPVLRVVGEDGHTRAVMVNYACHCTTLVGGHEFVHADWAGDAADRIETAHDGAVALVVIGCGADADPQPRGALANVALHGAAVAAEVRQVLSRTLRPLGPVTETQYREIQLPLARQMTREDLQARADTARSPYTARQWLARSDAGETIPASIDYPVQMWAFGRDLTMIFLGGEVVADYSLRLHRELDGERLWVSAYTNSVPSYIPSERMFAEGGYEPDFSIDYYGLPGPLSPTIEDQIVAEVKAIVPSAFRAARSSSP